MTPHRTALTTEFRAGVIPSETRPVRTEPMTPEEFTGYLAAIRDELIRAGLPLFRDDMIACQEKSQREAGAARTEGGQR